MNTPAVPVGAATVLFPLAGTLIVELPAPFILYVMVTAVVCGLVNVTFGDPALWHTVVVPLIVGAGVARTVTVAVPPIAVTHVGAL